MKEKQQVWCVKSGKSRKRESADEKFDLMENRKTVAKKKNGNIYKYTLHTYWHSRTGTRTYTHTRSQVYSDCESENLWNSRNLITIYIYIYTSKSKAHAHTICVLLDFIPLAGWLACSRTLTQIHNFLDAWFVRLHTQQAHQHIGAVVRN